MPNGRKEPVASEDLPGYGHLRCLLTPGVALAFFVMQPRLWWLVLAFVAVTFVIDSAAEYSPGERRQPSADRDVRPFDAMLYALFAIHWANLLLAARMVGESGWMTLQAPAALLLLVLSSALSVIVAHELIHRAGVGEQWMGRLILVGVLFEHFVPEHLRTHHSRVGTGNDPATARPGEAFWPYLARNLPAQFAGSWRLERGRLAGQGAWFLRPLRNHVLQGVLLEAGMLGIVFAAFGTGGLVLVLVNAAAVMLIVHAVSYFQHWGLARDGALRAAHSWDAPGRSNLFSMVGMARHADHHLHPDRPYHLLRYVDDSPKLPRAYGGMIWLAIMENAKFQRLMTEALTAR